MPSFRHTVHHPSVAECAFLRQTSMPGARYVWRPPASTRTTPGDGLSCRDVRRRTHSNPSTNRSAKTHGALPSPLCSTGAESLGCQIVTPSKAPTRLGNSERGQPVLHRIIRACIGCWHRWARSVRATRATPARWIGSSRGAVPAPRFRRRFRVLA